MLRITEWAKNFPAQGGTLKMPACIRDQVFFAPLWQMKVRRSNRALLLNRRHSRTDASATRNRLASARPGVTHGMDDGGAAQGKARLQMYERARQWKSAPLAPEIPRRLRA